MTPVKNLENFSLISPLNKNHPPKTFQSTEFIFILFHHIKYIPDHITKNSNIQTEGDKNLIEYSQTKIRSRHLGVT